VARKDELKKLRQQRRLEKKEERQKARDALAKVRQVLNQYTALGDPASFPGTCDETLARPDHIKAELMEFAIHRFPGKPMFEQLDSGLRRGVLHYLPDIDHWAMEEFAWHGLPGESWQPVDQYLRQPNLPFSAAARAQISLWKKARIGFFEIGPIAGDTISLREWDVLEHRPIGDQFRAITLNLGGVHVHAGHRGMLLLTHISPWDPDHNICCGMGYGACVPKNEALIVHDFLGLRQLEVVSRPLPWRLGRESERRWLREWRHREWYGWFAERIQFPFDALVPTPPKGVPQLVTIHELHESTPADAERMGIYFYGDSVSGNAMMAGATSVTPLDVASPNRLAFAEYQAFREIAGPPVAVRGQPTFMEVGREGR
jgi:hypothetical protein